MKATVTLTLIVLGVVLIALTSVNPAMAATNQATDPGGGGVTLTNSNTVTVTSTALTIVKQVWVNGACMASSDTSGGADSCNGNTDTVVVPAGTAVQFLIFVRNTSDVQISDARIQDLIDDTAGAAGGFTYVVAPATDGITATPDGSFPTDVETAALIRAAATQGQSDAIDVGVNNYVSIVDTGADNNGDQLTIGAVTGQVNEILNIPAHTTFAVLIPATKN